MSSQGPANTSTSGPPEWLQDYYRTYMDAGAAQAQQPYTPYQGQRVADLSGLQTGALHNMGALANGTQSLHDAENSLHQTLTGGYQNPFQEQVINRTTQGAEDAYTNATRTTARRANTAGNWQSARANMAEDRNQQNLAQGLGDSLGALYSGNYESERNRQMQAAGMAPGLNNQALSGLSTLLQAGDIPRLQQQRLLDSQYGDFTDQRDYGWNQLARLGGVLGVTNNGVPHSTSSRQGYDPVSQGVGMIGLGNQLYNGYQGKGGDGVGDADVVWN